MSLFVCKDPEIVFIDITKLLHPKHSRPKGIDPNANIGDSVRLGNNVSIGPFTVIEEGSSIGDNTDIRSGAYIGRNVTIGKHCAIYPYAVIYDDVCIGDHVIVHSGAIIGAEGFGYKRRHDLLIKMPQIGAVVIEDNVEIGSNTCIDRGAYGNTYIKAGTKIDNLVQIGHNDHVGKNVIICGQTGISGSCTIGDNATLAGNSGVADHVNIGNNAIILARSGVLNDIKENHIVFGTPAKDRRVAWREISTLSKLPELMKRIKMIEEQLETLGRAGENADGREHRSTKT
ncbi:UDP-3-O-(3-hydroxymyristoyl)glucosamine N-acyltransferase [uncultured Desulfobacter sp.]|uniref:UDP-3-O-(3-hydroxymyristoyl)glucosamine N-acyltransferase n=1 Tax=uncultured Desulfobacter sp. TaxID=240139 RepID=UPI002AA6BE89|nr:UDP-3-O-(3-hydroxymyristoyl)glucosamine N-acyltransferase [uncultured Desulfobacter sp.]